MCESDVGATELVFHEIDTGTSRPIRQPVRRLSYGEQCDVVEHEFSKLVEAKIVLPSTSPVGVTGGYG